MTLPLDNLILVFWTSAVHSLGSFRAKFAILPRTALLWRRLGATTPIDLDGLLTAWCRSREHTVAVFPLWRDQRSDRNLLWSSNALRWYSKGTNPSILVQNSTGSAASSFLVVSSSDRFRLSKLFFTELCHFFLCPFHLSFELIIISIL